MTFLEEYIQAIDTGEILVGQELESVLHQLQKETQDPRYRYEPKRAQKRIQFIERFCKHTKSPFHGKPFKLELWEITLIEVIHYFTQTPLINGVSNVSFNSQGKPLQKQLFLCPKICTKSMFDIVIDEEIVFFVNSGIFSIEKDVIITSRVYIRCRFSFV